MAKAVTLLLAATYASLFAPLAFAQPYPTKTIRYIIAFPPGGSNDIFARVVGARMSELMGVQVIVDNRPGGGANIGAEAIARAAPDGYTIGNISATHTINATLYPKLGYDVLKDFTPIVKAAEIPLLLAAHPVVPAKGPKDIVTRLNAEITKILSEPATREKISAQGFNVTLATPDELGRFIRSEHEKLGKLVKQSGAKVD